MSGETVLIVEDEPILAKELQLRLQSAGYQILGPSPSGEQALTMAQTSRPDIALMDIRLKGQMDGIEAAQNLWATLGVPVIYLTGHDDHDVVGRAMRSGAFGYLVKPVKDRELEIAIGMALQRHRAEQQTRTNEWWFRALVQVLTDAVIALDSNGTVRYLNPEAERILETSQNIAAGKPIDRIFKIIDPSTLAPVREPIAPVLQQGRVIRGPMHAILNFPGADEDREERIEWAAIPMKVETGQVAGAVVILRKHDEAGRAKAAWAELVNLVSDHAPPPLIDD